jgi:hypothetical protein
MQDIMMKACEEKVALLLKSEGLPEEKCGSAARMVMGVVMMDLMMAMLTTPPKTPDGDSSGGLRF